MNASDRLGFHFANGARMECVRRNHATARIVEEGIALQETCGTRCAAEFLRQKKVSLAVATRVLLFPALRRNYRLAVHQ